MWINKIILSTIIVSFVVFRQVETGISNEVTIEEYLGVRYVVAIAIADTTNPVLSCAWMNITRKSNDTERYTAFSWMRANNILYVHKNEGIIIDSELHYTSKFAPEKELYSTVTKYSDSELFIFPKNHSYQEQFAQLVSRTLTISDGAKKAFEDMSSPEGVRVVHINHNNCTYGK